MIPKTFTQEIRLKDGRTITLETGKLAKQAHGSVVVRMENCMLLCTVVSNYNSVKSTSFTLTVDYQEKFAAAGRYPGRLFQKRSKTQRWRNIDHATCGPCIATIVPKRLSQRSSGDDSIDVS